MQRRLVSKANAWVGANPDTEATALVHYVKEKIDSDSLPTLLSELRETLLRLNAFGRQAQGMACHPKPKT